MEGAPLSDIEKRIVVTEALRLSQVPLEKLLDLLREAQVVPQWEDMVLPPGRTVTMCKNAFSILFRPSQPPPPFHPIPHLPGPITTNKRKSGAEIYDPRAYVEPPTKRRQSIIETKPGARELAPKPSNGSPSPMGSVPGKVAKKRGRPSKADVERNKAEAIAKGVIMAPTMTMATPSPQGAPDEVGSYSNLAPNLPTASKGTFYDPTLKGTFEVESPRPYPGDSPGKKKRKPPAKPKPPTTGQNSFTILPPMLHAREEQMQAPISIATTQPGPVSGSTERLPPSLPRPFAMASEPQAVTEPRPDI